MMNCRACGTPLPNQATHCPRCGVATSPYAAETFAAPDAPTVASETPPPPPPAEYGFSPYPYPYESSSPGQAPRRRARRVGILLGTVLLVLLLIGGGIFALRAFSSGNSAFSAATATAHASATATAQHMLAKGMLTVLDSTTVNTQQDGENQIITQTVHIAIFGDIMGSFTNDETTVQHPDKTATFTGTSICTCTVAGKAGTLFWSFSGTQAADGHFQGRLFDFHGTGDLALIHGQGTFQGLGDHGTYSSDLFYSS